MYASFTKTDPTSLPESKFGDQVELTSISTDMMSTDWEE